MKGKQEGGGKTKEMTRIRRTSPQAAGVATSNATTASVAEEAENATSVGNNRACFDGESRKDKHSSSEKSGAGTRDRIAKKRSLCYGYR